MPCILIQRFATRSWQGITSLTFRPTGRGLIRNLLPLWTSQGRFPAPGFRFRVTFQDRSFVTAQCSIQRWGQNRTPRAAIRLLTLRDSMLSPKGEGCRIREAVSNPDSGDGIQHLSIQRIPLAKISVRVVRV